MNVQIDDELLCEAMKVTGHRTKRGVVEAGLRTLIRINKQAGIRQLKGKIRFEREQVLDEMVRENQRLGFYDNPPSPSSKKKF